MADRSISDLVRAAATGDQQAWREIVDRHSSLVWSVVRSHRLLDMDAGDVFQTTWLRLVENLGRLHQPEQLSAWLVTTARRECLRQLRRREREVPDTDTLDASATTGPADATLLGVSGSAVPSPDVAYLRRERDLQLLAAYQRLSKRCQALLRLYLADPPLSYQEVADMLGMPVGTVGPSRGRCLAHLRRLLASYTEADPAEGGV